MATITAPQNQGGTSLYRRLVPFIVLGLCASAQAEQSARTWKFDLKTSGTYDIHVQHKFDGTDSPREFLAHYTFQTKEKTDKRDVPISLGGGEGHRVAVLAVDVPSPQKASVVVTGIPQPLLKKTRVYVVEANSVSPERMFDPKNSVELKSAKHIREILELPAQKIDLAKAKLIVDKQIDPAVDVDTDLQKIETMVARIKTMPGFGTSKTVNMQLLKRYIYEPGEWNNFRPYQYDLDDPLGTKISNKLLSNYIASKKGNCITMPFLFIILGQRLGIDVTASTAPNHVFVKAKDEVTGAWYNLETTSGADPARDVWIRQQMPMTDKAVANGLYLQPLTKKETVALMAGTLAEYYVQQKELEKLITIADIVLEYYPKNTDMMITKANAYYDLSSKYYLEKYRSPNEIPADARGHYRYLYHNNKFWGAKAAELGWREQRKEDEEKYLQSVKNTKRKPVN